MRTVRAVGPALAPALALVLVLATAPARAADEIELYDGEIAPVGAWFFQQHLNYGLRARRLAEFPGGLAADRAFNGTPELSRGVTPWYETTLYAPFAVDRTGTPYAGAFKMRHLFVTPDAEARSWSFGLGAEFSYQPHRFSRSRWNLELRPILAWRAGPWTVVSNPIVETGLGGRQPAILAPAHRVARAFGDHLAFGAELYSDLGRLESPEPRLARQAHQLFAVTDFRLGGVEINLGIGRGLTPAADRWVVKTIVGFGF